MEEGGDDIPGHVDGDPGNMEKWEEMVEPEEVEVRGSFVKEWRGHHTGHGSHGGAPQLLEFGGAADPLGPSRGIGQQGQQAMVRPQRHSPHLYIERGLEVQSACGKWEWLVSRSC